MAGGPNQHYLPQFVQRAFAFRPRRKDIWVYSAEGAGELRPTKHVGASDHFYSEPAADGSRTLDDDITDVETPISRLLRSLREKKEGDAVDGEIVAVVLDHLVPRTAHVRASLDRGLKLMARGVVEIISDAERVEALVGLDEDGPNDRFRERLAGKLDEIEGLRELGLPPAVIERVAFFLAKENLQSLAADFVPQLRDMVTLWLAGSGSFVRESHNRALAQVREESPRKRAFERLEWSILAAPAPAAILPDCVAIAIDFAGHASPAMFADIEDLAAIMLPLTPEKLLLGVSAVAAAPSLADYNRQAAACSHDFFLAHINDPAFAELCEAIGDRSVRLVDEGVGEAMAPYLAVTPKPRDPDMPIYPADVAGRREGPWQYELAIDGSSEEEGRRLAKTIQMIVAELAAALPLHRLDGITITADYRGALAALDRGYEGANAPDTAPEEIGQGVARSVTVKRSGVWKQRIVLDAGLGFALLADDAASVEWGLETITRQLTEVAINDMVAEHFPSVWMQPIEDPFQAFLYPHLHSAIFAYLSAHVNAGFGNPPDLLTIRRDLFLNALRVMVRATTAARLDYRFDGDLDSLLAIAMPRIGYTLQFAADLLGHCAATGLDPYDEDGVIEAALADAGLRNWFSLYRGQLECLRLRMGRWETFEEFLALTVHVERLMWQLGLLPWQGSDGMRIEVPLGTDIEELMRREHDE